MTSEEFVQRMYENAVVGGVRSCLSQLEAPPGRKPDKTLVDESNWFISLGPADRAFVQRCMKNAAEMALFSVFTVFDGVSTIEEIGPKGEFKLFFEKDGSSTLLNPSDGEMLHDLMPR
jgi:hypothetical protein